MTRPLDLDGSEVTAVLGPTNTGKTHHALQAVLGARSGMIGLPLRLLAREVYDRMRAVKGDAAVALVTGEEKIVPPTARYFACTVEAMPLDRPVEVLAVDEIQLCADRTRGHVFTDRILRARGLRHTLLLGSDTVAGLVRALVPTARLQSRPRLSELRYAEPRKITSLPPRSAVVGFSVDRVYSLAERLKARHGGVAVVLGALSPRARNAQVALYQSGEVAYLVATDAIGMGLNLDVDRVAFADLDKFDGRGHRPLTPAELAQIAGRAGRHTKDGRFGTLTELPPLAPDVIRAIETHTFDPVTTAWWRHPDPDTSSLDALLATLRERPPSPRLRRMPDADDHVVLEQLAAREDVRARATTPAAVARLWEVARVPDFRKTLTDAHAQLLATLYGQLVDGGRLDPRWVEDRVARLDRVDGDLDALMTRIAWVRTWRYVAYRRDWLEAAAGWQERTRAIEDRLSDAVHAALTERFVDRRLRLRVAGPAVVLDGEDLVANGEIVGRVDGLTVHTRGHRLAGAVRAALAERLAERARACADAPDSAFRVDDAGAVRWDGAVVAQLFAGPDWRSPRVRHRRHEHLPVDARRAVAARVERFVRDTARALVSPLHRGGELSAAARAVVFRLEDGLLTVSRKEVSDVIRRLSDADRKALARRDVRVGRLAVYVGSRLKPRWVEARAWLDGVSRGAIPLALVPPHGAVSAPSAGRSREAWARIGFWVAGPRAVRVDVAETVAAAIRRRSSAPEGLASRLGCSVEEAAAVARALTPR